LEQVWKLNDLPLTETYGKFSPDYPKFNQSVGMCLVCGHFQLGTRVSPKFLYSVDNYSFKSLGAKRDAEEEFFIDFISQLTSLQEKKLIEFGANDLSLAKKLSLRGAKVIAIDPLAFQSLDNHYEVETHQMMIEEYIDGTTELFDVIVARHTLEHVDNPSALVKMLIERLSEGGLIFLEFPSLDRIVSSLRGDAFFHQHYHYYDLASLKRITSETGSMLRAFRQNRQGSNGGSLMIALEKSNRNMNEIGLQTNFGMAFKSLDPHERLFGFSKFRQSFLNQMQIIQELIEANTPSIGIGAGLMTPVLDYHLKGAISRLLMILDDDPTKHATSYRNLDVEIRHPAKTKLPEDFSAVITSLENPKQIFERARSLGAQKIIGLPIS
jgi:hypothetical protein